MRAQLRISVRVRMRRWSSAVRRTQDTIEMWTSDGSLEFDAKGIVISYRAISKEQREIVLPLRLSRKFFVARKNSKNEEVLEVG